MKNAGKRYTGGGALVNSKNFYIIAAAPNEPSLQVNISGPYPSKQAAEADLDTAISKATNIDPSAKNYKYSISLVKDQKPGVIQHMGSQG